MTFVKQVLVCKLPPKGLDMLLVCSWYIRGHTASNGAASPASAKAQNNGRSGGGEEKGRTKGGYRCKPQRHCATDNTTCPKSERRYCICR